MLKYTKCPRCGEKLLMDCWTNERKLQQECYAEGCYWHGEPRIPNKQTIQFEKEICVNRGSWQYDIYDKYGHIMISSRSYPTREEAIEALTKDCENNNKNTNVSPVTSILWPPTVKVKGERDLHEK